jgi:hypothetical protein
VANSHFRQIPESLTHTITNVDFTDKDGQESAAENLEYPQNLRFGTALTYFLKQSTA